MERLQPSHFPAWKQQGEDELLFPHFFLLHIEYSVHVEQQKWGNVLPALSPLRTNR